MKKLYPFNPVAWEHEIHPGLSIQEKMKDAGLLSNEVLAIRMGISLKTARNLIDSTEPITESVAKKLEHVFEDIPASFWLNLEANYRQARENKYQEAKALHKMRK